MASAQLLLLSLVVMAATGAPQFGDNSDELPTPYDFAYGVNVPDTGDAKEHKESVSPSGRTEGEYRWLQPNGLYLVVRYIVDGNSGFQADVNEEPGAEVANYYTNTLDGQSSSGAVASQDFARSFDATQSTVNVFATPQPSFSPSQSFSASQPSFNPSQSFSASQPSFNPSQSFTASQPSFNPSQSFTASQPAFSPSQSFNNQRQSFSSQKSFSGQQEFFNNVVDGGVIDGGVIDGGIIDGGIIDGGIIN